MNQSYIVFMQMSGAFNGSIFQVFDGIAKPLLMSFILLACFVMMVARANISVIFMVFVGGWTFVSYDHIARFFGFEGLPERSTPINDMMESHHISDAIGAAAPYFLDGVAVLVLIGGSLYLANRTYRDWPGWFEFRVAVLTLAINFLYWKLGIKDPYARVMVDLQRMGDVEAFEPLSFPESISASIEHQPWLPWTGVAAEDDIVPSDYMLVEVTMFDHEASRISIRPPCRTTARSKVCTGVR